MTGKKQANQRNLACHTLFHDMTHEREMQRGEQLMFQNDNKEITLVDEEYR